MRAVSQEWRARNRAEIAARRRAKYAAKQQAAGLSVRSYTRHVTT
jgi:hypothetical protein